MIGQEEEAEVPPTATLSSSQAGRGTESSAHAQ